MCCRSRDYHVKSWLVFAEYLQRNYFLYGSTKLFVRWMHGTCIETPPQKAEGEDEPVIFSFFTDFSITPSVLDLFLSISKLVQTSLGGVNKYISRWKRYRLLWSRDKVSHASSAHRLLCMFLDKYKSYFIWQSVRDQSFLMQDRGLEDIYFEGSSKVFELQWWVTKIKVTTKGGH